MRKLNIIQLMIVAIIFALSLVGCNEEKTTEIPTGGQTSSVWIVVEVNNNGSPNGGLIKLVNNNGNSSMIYQVIITERNTSFYGVVNGTYTLTITHTNYNTYTVNDLQVQDGTVTHRVTLQAKTGGGGGYEIGSTGPAGGLIFYDKCNNTGGWRYLEAAPEKANFFARWGNIPDVKGTQTEIGTGKQNTQLIIAEYHKIPWEKDEECAAKICAEMTVNDYSDWFLPSKDELFLMYENLGKNGLGNFGNSYYFSSSQGGPNNYSFAVWGFHFYYGNWGDVVKPMGTNVRPVRSF